MEQAGEAVQTVKWEYFIDKINIKAHGPEAFAAAIAPLGEQGWELVSMVYLEGAERLDKASHYIIFKRPVYS